VGCIVSESLFRTTILRLLLQQTRNVS